MIKKLLKKYDNQLGFTLIEIMIGIAVLGGLSTVMIQMSRDQAKLALKARLDFEFSVVNTQINAYLTSPNDCNANFYSKALSNAAVPAVYACTAGSTCHGSNTFAALTSGAAWTTGSKVRITNISYQVLPVSGITLSLLTYAVTFQTRLDEAGATRQIIKKFYIPVVIDGTISGCPHSSNSLVVY